MVNNGILLETGDQLLTEYGFNLMLESESIELIDDQAENDQIEKEADAILDFTEFDPFSEGERG
jgi:hypothetical protein